MLAEFLRQVLNLYQCELLLRYHEFELHIPSILLRSARPFLLVAASSLDLSRSSLSSFSLWFLAAAPLIFFGPPFRPFVVRAELSSDSARDADLLGVASGFSSFSGVGEAEPVRCLFGPSDLLLRAVRTTCASGMSSTHSAL